MKRYLTLLAAVLAPLAQAHISLEQPSAAPGAYHKLTFRVGHGCDGSATRAITVTLPEGVVGAKPMPKAGWSVATVEAKLAVPLQSHGKSIASAVREVSWQGGPLPDAHYDEFSMQVKLPDTTGKLYFKVAQLCEQGRMDWAEIPVAGGARPQAPAPVLELVPASAPQHQH